jgi:hypothetical protein
MSADVQQLEKLKIRLAKAVFFLNFGLGVIALPLSLVVFQIPLSYFIVGWIPTLGGYSLLAGYWVEMRSSIKESYAFWVVSLLFNLLGVFCAPSIAFADNSTVSMGVRIFEWLVLFWTSLMSAASFYQARLSYQIYHPTACNTDSV